MEIVLILVPVTLVLVALGILLFSWAVKNGQYDDLDGPAHRILYDDDKDMIPKDARQDLTKAEKQEAQEQDPRENKSEENKPEEKKPEPGQPPPASDRNSGPDAPR